MRRKTFGVAQITAATRHTDIKATSELYFWVIGKCQARRLTWECLLDSAIHRSRRWRNARPPAAIIGFEVTDARISWPAHSLVGSSTEVAAEQLHCPLPRCTQSEFVLQFMDAFKVCNRQHLTWNLAQSWCPPETCSWFRARPSKFPEMTMDIAPRRPPSLQHPAPEAGTARRDRPYPAICSRVQVCRWSLGSGNCASRLYFPVRNPSFNADRTMTAGRFSGRRCNRARNGSGSSKLNFTMNPSNSVWSST